MYDEQSYSLRLLTIKVKGLKIWDEKDCVHTIKVTERRHLFISMVLLRIIIFSVKYV